MYDLISVWQCERKREKTVLKGKGEAAKLLNSSNENEWPSLFFVYAKLCVVHIENNIELLVINSLIHVLYLYTIRIKLDAFLCAIFKVANFPVIQILFIYITTYTIYVYLDMKRRNTLKLNFSEWRKGKGNIHSKKKKM